MKRWYSVIESYSPKIIYKPGSTNVVADALSRIQINNLNDSNIEMKRWYSVIKSYSPKIIYKPGSTNAVADALSRIQINNLNDSNESASDQNTQHSAERSFKNVIQETRKPLNQFKQ